MTNASPDMVRGHARQHMRGPGIDLRIADTLRRLTRAQPEAVTLRATFDEGRIDIDLIKVEPELRGRGLAALALRALLAFADRWSIPVRLRAISLADSGSGLDEKALLAWYRRLGFEDTGQRSVTGLTIMLRVPRAECPCVKSPGHLHQSHRHLAGLSGRTPPPREGRSFALPKHR